MQYALRGNVWGNASRGRGALRATDSRICLEAIGKGKR